jgi:hypothetical protein
MKYVQGMNEIVGLTYYVLRDESHAFWCFSSIMSQMKDSFMAEADSTHEGIYSQIDELHRLLREYDNALYRHLDHIGVPISALALRWLTTILATDVNMEDALRIWDVALKAVPSGDLLKFSLHLTLAYLVDMSPYLQVTTDVQECLEFAGGYGMSPDVDIDRLITTASSIHAFETLLRGKYSPNSDEPLLEVLGDVFENAREKVAGLVGLANSKEVRDEVIERVANAKAEVSGWLTSIAAKIPRK